MGIIKHKFDAEFESVEKSAKKHPKQVIGSKLLHTVIKIRVSDPYSFFTDPDPEDPGGGQYGSGSGSRSRALMT